MAGRTFGRRPDHGVELDLVRPDAGGGFLELFEMSRTVVDPFDQHDLEPDLPLEFPAEPDQAVDDLLDVEAGMGTIDLFEDPPGRRVQGRHDDVRPENSLRPCRPARHELLVRTTTGTFVVFLMPRMILPMPEFKPGSPDPENVTASILRPLERAALIWARTAAAGIYSLSGRWFSRTIRAGNRRNPWNRS